MITLSGTYCNVESFQWPTIPKKNEEKRREENAIETRSVTQGDLAEVGRSTRAKKAIREHRQVTAHLGLAIQSKLMLEIF